ncbi:MAG: polysaccharide deacetylase family protein [Bacteroidetes bacterium]|nr:polysaccharide deacetylase family protein [Bacteroidota bacterium]
MNKSLLIQPNRLLRNLYPKAVWNLSRKEKTIYLTFDDGPIPELTEWILDELAKHKATATFFCVGQNIVKNKPVFERMVREGHQVANHTVTHIKGFKHSVAEYLLQANECRALVNNNLFRPPYGRMKRAQYKALLKQGFKIVMWDVITYDYENISPEACAHKAVKHTQNGSIVLFHDNIKAEANVKYALPLFLKHFSEKGFVFKGLTL